MSPEALDVGATFAGKKVLLIGATGFVGKVALSMLLRRYPQVGKVFVLVRPGMGNTAVDRFFTKVATSPAFDPLREQHGARYQDFLHDKVAPIPGDIGRPLCNFGDEQFAEFAAAGGLDAVVNSAGLVSFTPSLESALRINAQGAQNVLEAARKAGAALMHVSTCYVAGQRNGEIWEDEPVVGYFPRKGELRDQDFSAAAEIADCQRLIEQVREQANDRAHISEFRERAAEQLLSEGRDPDDDAALKLAVARERKKWMNVRLTDVGMERATHWGWTNTYTYSKSLGEQVILADREVRAAVLRPAVVESSLKYPFPGWNEGFNTTAPLMYMVLKGHRNILMGERTPLDVVPVDLVAIGMLMATAALLAGRNEPVYQAGSSDLNTVSSARLTELTALAARRHWRTKAKAGENRLVNRVRARLEAMPVSPRRFDRFSAPQIKRLAEGASKLIDEHVPRWGAPRVVAWAERAKEELGKVSEFTGRAKELIELFKPFTHDFDVQFRCDNLRALHGQLTPEDQALLPWRDVETIDWRSYWLDTHFPGLEKWVFPMLDDEFGAKPRSVYTYKDLLELFDSTTKRHRHRVAMRLLPTKETDGEPIVYSYARVHDMAQQAAAALRQHGVQPGQHVMLMAENRPEWGITYFGILKAGATAVPLDSQLSAAEVANLVRASGARLLVASQAVLDRLSVEGGALGVEAIELGALLDEPALSPGAFEPPRKGDAVASLIFTSGTTGTPKGVMLTHKNLTSMVAKLASVFTLYKHDGLLSVLPLHHTFEFSAGLLMPLMAGAQITYLDEINAESLQAAFAEGNITGLVGVPALWQLLHRKIFKQVAERGPLVQRGIETIIDVNRKLRDATPYGWNLGRLAFFPVHRKLGGRLRLLISGGSALPVDVMKSFQGLGFKLFEGYGMTEASPVLTVTRPGDKLVVGSVGRPLPGIDVKIHEPDERGVGEVIAKGPNVMAGYFGDAAATGAVLQGGWLHTGDLGRIDGDGNLYIVGRKKEMILGASGENVYPDELEEVYRDSPYIKEVSVVGLPAGDGAETVAALVVPEYEKDGLGREEVRERVREHLKNVSAKLPLYKRIKVVHLWDHDLPKTSTRKVKRREVIKELQRLERAAGSGARAIAEVGGEDASWVRGVIAQVAQKPRDKVQPATRLDELGFDSLMFTELGVAIDAAGLALPDPHELTTLETVADVERYAAQRLAAQKRSKPAPRPRPSEVSGEADEIRVPAPVVALGRRGLRFAQRMTYERLFETTVTGRAYVPPFGGYLVAANHSSHLDMGLVKHALGETGPLLVALAAKDYFFEDPVRRMYFENFTNLVPMERHGSLRESLRLASDVIKQGYILLIFPEGTRSETGVMTDFKPSIGYLAMANRCGILPMYLAGTHDALPKGALLPKRRDIAAHVGPFMPYEKLRALAEGRARSESYRVISADVERAVRKLAPNDYAWTLGEAGRTPLAPAAVEDDGA